MAHVHVRTDPSQPFERLCPLLNACDVVSLDLLANTAQTHERLVTDGRYEEAVTAIQTLVAEREGDLPWIVPRITRCDLTLGEIEGFYDHWLMRCGAAVIDPLPQTASDRLAPLTPTPLAQKHARARTLVIDAQGRAATGWEDRTLGAPVADAMSASLADTWNAVKNARNAD